MATKTIKVSDLTGEEIRNEERLARLVVEEHPELPDSVTLEVLPEEVEDKFPEEQNGRTKLCPRNILSAV